MTFSLIFLTAGIALAFTTWPIIGKFSGASGAWVATLVLAGTLITTLLFGAKDMIQGPMFSLKALTILSLAGLLNGVAFYYYSARLVDQSIPTGIFVTTTLVLMILITPILDWFFNGNTMNTKQILGLSTAMLTVYLLKG